MIQFDDDHEGGKVYYAEHLSVADPVRGKMKVTRRGFAYADAGDRVFVTHEIATEDGDGVRIAPDPKKRNFLNNDLRLSKEGPDGLKAVGSASAGGGSWTFESHFKRSNAKRWPGTLDEGALLRRALSPETRRWPSSTPLWCTLPPAP